jgi:superfamily I DNA/RNA helicase
MRERLARLLGEEVANGVAAGTFHSFCHRLLRRELHLLPGSKWDRDFSL